MFWITCCCFWWKNDALGIIIRHPSLYTGFFYFHLTMQVASRFHFLSSPTLGYRAACTYWSNSPKNAVWMWLYVPLHPHYFCAVCCHFSRAQQLLQPGMRIRMAVLEVFDRLTQKDGRCKWTESSCKLHMQTTPEWMGSAKKVNPT